MFKNKSILFYLLIVVNISNVFSRSHLRRNSEDENENIVKDEGKLKVPEDVEYIKKETVNTRACWPKFEVTKYYKILDNLDDKYAEVRQNYQAAVGVDNFDADMLAMLIKSGGVAERTAYVSGDRTHIPAGINLGGYSMMRVPKNILFFHRMKLRNDTHFRVQYLQNDLENMVLRSRIALNDLRVMGSFDRAITDSNPSNLFYVPTFGKAEFLLKNVKYSMEGRYRLIQNTLNLVLVISELKVDDVIMVYHINASKPSARLEKRNVDGFLDRLKTDLDHWLKDYFNDYLTYYSIAGRDLNSEFQKYDAEKALALNDFTDNAINVIIRKLHRVKAGSVKLPNFTIYALNGMQLQLRDGVLRGLDTMYRRSVATGVKQEKIRKVDALVAFSNLKVTYGYTALTTSEAAPLTGSLILTTDELVARLSMSLVKNPESVDMAFEFLQQVGTESLTVEGPANRMISQFNFLLERHIIAIMSNTVIHNIKMLSTISRCVPILVPFNDSNEIVSEESTDIQETYIENQIIKGNENDGDENFEENINIDNDNKDNFTADYVLWKKDSVELEFPPKEGSEKKQKMFIKYNENFALGKINNKN